MAIILNNTLNSKHKHFPTTLTSVGNNKENYYLLMDMYIYIYVGVCAFMVDVAMVK